MAIKHNRFVWLVPALLGTTALLGAATPSHAWPTTSPSAKSAARLKYHPPNNWLQHYLPDDRYKIAGGVWKVVSTQYDTYYHRPDSQYMLRQPAGIVIGFASAKEAEEAGYRPDGSYFVGSRVRGRSKTNGRKRVRKGSTVRRTTSTLRTVAASNVPLPKVDFSGVPAVRNSNQQKLFEYAVELALSNSAADRRKAQQIVRFLRATS